jgi:hypothetical protein
MATQPCTNCPCFGMHEKVDRRGQPGGYPGLETTGTILPACLGTGEPGPTKFLKSDGTWSEIGSSPGGGLTQAQVLTRGLGC